MTNKKLIILLIILGITLIIGIYAPVKSEAVSQEAKGHLVYDKIDDVNYCLGTPIDCTFVQ